MYSHKPIKRFGLTGEIYDESHITRLKDQYEFMITRVMREHGYVPRYDIDIDFTVSYNGKTFDFEMSVYGVYVGRAKAKCITGLDKNKVAQIPSIQKIKSSEAS